MKKTLIIAASILAIAGCKKAELAPEQGQENLITRKVSLAAEVSPASDDATVKSFFDTTDEFVKLTGAEELAVAYSNADESTYESIVKGTSDGSSNYSFSHSAIANATEYNYYFILPYRDSKNINLNSKKTGLYVQLDSIQHPTATSFDPLQDYIMGQPIYNAKAQATEMTAENLKLKRLFALVRLTLNDSQKVLKGEALDQVSFSFPPARENKQNTSDHKKHNLINRCYLTFSKDFNDSKISGYGDWGTDQARATVTAEYNEGLAPGEDGKYTVWYVTMPVEKLQGTELTVVVKSGIKTITRTVAIPAAMALQAGVINDIKFDISGTGYDSKEIDTNDYWSLYNAGQSITVGGQVINKTNHPGGVLLEGTNLIKDNLEKGGLIFVDGNLTVTGHLKLAKGSFIIGRYKNLQPTITMDSNFAIYFDNGNIILKNLNIISSTASRLMVMSANDNATSSDYATVEDCTIYASKHVCGYASGIPKYVIKDLTFNNCIIKMAGTDANYSIININTLSAANTDSSIYKDITKFEISNCVIYAEKPYLNVSNSLCRRMLMDLGSGSAGGKYDFPLENAAIVVNNNTIYNINTNGNVLVRAYYAKSAEINGNVVYNDFASLAPSTNFKASYMFGLYSGYNNSNNGEYNIKKNYSYSCYDTETQEYYVKTVIDNDITTLDDKTMSWTYSKKEVSPSYKTSSNNQVNDTNKNYPFTTVNLSKGYFPVNSANIQTATGASYDTKYWITAGK